MDQLIRKKMETQFSCKEIPKKANINQDILDKFKTNLDTVADFIAYILQFYGEYITPMRIQKLSYYAQAWFLAFFDRPLFEEDFQAWPYGPANYDMYHRFKDCGKNSIPEVDEPPNLPEPVGEHIVNVLNIYAVYTAFGLGKKTHEEKPWQEARGDLPENATCSTIITKEAIKIYYREKYQCCKIF